MGGFASLLGAAGGFLVGGPAGAALGAQLGGGIDASSAARSASRQQAASAEAGLAETRRQFDIAQQLNRPFYEAAVGTPVTNRLAGRLPGAAGRAVGSALRMAGQSGAVPRTGGALQQLQEGLEQAPALPELQEFQFDPRQALESPSLQFQQEMGQQALSRQLAGNRQLGSGERLLEAQRFGQGLASQSIGEEFGRQQTLANMERNRLLSQYGLANEQFNQRLNRLAGIVDVGARTGSAMGSQAIQQGQTAANLLQAQGQAQAAGTLGQQSALSSGITGATGLYALGGGFNNMFAQQPAAQPGFVGPAGNLVSQVQPQQQYNPLFNPTFQPTGLF